MGNFSKNVGLIHFMLSTKSDNDIKESLQEIFNADSDFTSNEEYFRRDTLKKGYKNEAHRIVTEYVNSHSRINTLKRVENAVSKLAEKVFLNDTYFSGYEISITEVSTDLFSVAIAYAY